MDEASEAQKLEEELRKLKEEEKILEGKFCRILSEIQLKKK